MIYILRKHGFIEEKSARRKFLANEIHRLMTDIAELGLPGADSLVGNLIRQ
jgi:hypothetical protein